MSKTGTTLTSLAGKISSSENYSSGESKANVVKKKKKSQRCLTCEPINMQISEHQYLKIHLLGPSVQLVLRCGLTEGSELLKLHVYILALSPSDESHQSTDG